MPDPTLRELADHEGPFASVYVDNTHDTEDAAAQQRLRRRAVRAELSEKGATPAILDAVDDALSAGTPGRCGRAVITDRRSVVIAETLRTPPPQQVVRLSPLPYLLPLLALREPVVPYVVAVVDDDGADLSGADAYGQRLARTVRGDNVAATAREVTRLADRARASLILLAGDVTPRAAVCEAIAPRNRRIVQLGAASRATGRGAADLDEEIHRTLQEDADQRRRALADLFDRELGRTDGLAEQGVSGISAAIRAANVDTLLVDAAALGDRTVCVGSDPTQVRPLDSAREHTRRRRADEALPLAALAARADVITCVGDHSPADGVGALLRHG
ncbi:baeRF2 domain-containing protein [Nocardia aurantia]|uniref:Peptide chain release factor 1 n=1 Tax=Nocardia aurantia TaxID=2585199 RepID=A0A7K0DM06_9NOCA|nr:hypothetical protein [Nocardia aurantia]MQY26800.1 hypothetical protein [Nocardia aurantia]